MEGLYSKYIVRRMDFQDEPGCKHEECQYFVLDLTHDLIAREVLAEYARQCRNTNPKLADDLEREIKD